MQQSQKTRHFLTVILLVVIFFVFGVYVGKDKVSEIEQVKGLSNKEVQVNTEADFFAFWKTWNTINEKYPKATEIDDQEKVYGAISGLVDSLNDPYSVFFKPEEAKIFREEIAGNFTGVGMEVGMKDNVLTVIAPLKNTPAYRANIQPGDKILEIDGTLTSNMTIEDAIKLIRGDKGTPVVLTIFRENSEDNPLQIKIVRDVINIPTLDTELRSDDIFVIKLYSFSANAPSLFRNAMREFAVANTDKLILDLRGNPGGFLSAAVDISSWFLPKGKVVVTENYGDDRDSKVFRSKGHAVFNRKLNFAILINGGSASASEIVAGAMQDHGLAKLVGTQSFGKGSVQEAIKITPETLLKITVAKWLTPSDKLIEDSGLIPDHVVELTTENTKEGSDPQLEKAIEILLSS